MIIEDSLEDRKILMRYLEKEGISNVLFSENGTDGIKKADIEKPYLVVTDTVLPDISGFEVCRAVKESDDNEAKIIVMTGVIDAIDAVKARRMGADDYCVKTLNMAPMIEAVKNILKESE